MFNINLRDHIFYYSIEIDIALLLHDESSDV